MFDYMMVYSCSDQPQVPQVPADVKQPVVDSTVESLSCEVTYAFFERRRLSVPKNASPLAHKLFEICRLVFSEGGNCLQRRGPKYAEYSARALQLLQNVDIATRYNEYMKGKDPYQDAHHVIVVWAWIAQDYGVTIEDTTPKR